MITLILASLIPAFPAGEVKITPENYKGWDGAYRISNGLVELVVVPSIGRIMHFGYVNNRNILWENETLAGAKTTGAQYYNLGGDKCWPAPQSLWGWPPDPNIDGPAHTLETILNGVRMTSPVGKKIKVRFIRDIVMDPFKPMVTIRNRMENTGERIELAPWQITQIREPDQVVIPFESSPASKRGWNGYSEDVLDPAFHTLSGDTLIVKRSPKKSRKFGAFSRKGYLSASFGSTVFVSTAKVYRGQKYVDNNSPLQVFSAQDPDQYMELEHTGPLQRMETGESATLEVVWRLDGVK